MKIIALALAATLIHHDGEPNAEWYRGLAIPDGPMAGALCCTNTDCRPVAVRVRDGHWEAFIDSATFPDRFNSPLEGNAPNDWVAVPEQAILHGKSNPIGEPVVCFYNRVIRCFVEGTGT